MRQILQVFCSTFSGIALALAIPNEILAFGSPFIAMFALTPLYIALIQSKSSKEAFWLCALQGAVTHLLSSFWLGNFYGFAVFTLGASDIGTGILEGMMSLFFYFPLLFKKSQDDLEELAGAKPFSVSFRTVWFAGTYTVWEWVKSTGFLAYPWGTLSMTSYKWPLITQIADITGVYGITFLFAFFAALFGEGIMLMGNIARAGNGQAVLKNYRQPLICCSVLFALTIAYGIVQYTKKRPQAKTLHAVLVQQNKDPWIKGVSADDVITISQRLSEEKVKQFRTEHKKCDLVVWSEAMLTQLFPMAKDFYEYFPEEEPFFSFVRRMRTPFIVGAPVVMDAKKHHNGNSALFIDRNGNIVGSYQKMHLVPFAELIPGNQYEFVQKLLKKLVGFTYGWTPGARAVLYEIPLSAEMKDKGDWEIVPENKGLSSQKPPLNTVLISTPICFDDSAAEVCRAMHAAGSEIFMNITNDSWSKTRSAEIQHFVVSSFRAIEYRTTLARCANSGFTCVVAPNGSIIESLPLFEECSLAAEIPIYKRTMTTYAHFGNWLPKLLIMLIILFIFLTIEKKIDEKKRITEENSMDGVDIDETSE
ncbi:MAG: apolipoprotein N-acyltransferase [Treponema sp.]|nr:apolipoprotein N-acyltransferase [Treponema sp.]